MLGPCCWTDADHIHDHSLMIKVRMMGKNDCGFSVLHISKMWRWNYKGLWEWVDHIISFMSSNSFWIDVTFTEKTENWESDDLVNAKKFWIAVTFFSEKKTERATITMKDARPDHYYGNEDRGSDRPCARCHGLDGRDVEGRGGSRFNHLLCHPCGSVCGANGMPVRLKSLIVKWWWWKSLMGWLWLDAGAYLSKAAVMPLYAQIN